MKPEGQPIMNTVEDKKTYRVYYARVPLVWINNLCHPQYVPQFVDAFGGNEKYFHADNCLLRQKLATAYEKGFNEGIGHYKNLAEAFQKDGDFANPIFLTFANKPHWAEAKYLPTGNLMYSKKPFFLERLGGSRYLVASKYRPSCSLKAIITDWRGDLLTYLDDAIEIVHPAQAYKLFGKITPSNPTEQIEFGPKGCIMTAMDHFHIDKKIDGQKYTHAHQVPFRRSVIEKCILDVKTELGIK